MTNTELQDLKIENMIRRNELLKLQLETLGLTAGQIEAYIQGRIKGLQTNIDNLNTNT